MTFGHLVGEVVRRVDGRTIGTFLHDEITAPLGVDCFLGLPTAEDAAPRRWCSRRSRARRSSRAGDPDSLGPKSFGNPPDCNDPAHTNTRTFRAAEIPAANAHANARALARRVRRARAAGSDPLARPARRGGPRARRRARPRHGAAHTLGLGFEITMPEAGFSFGPGARTFGHNGSGGSLGSLDPDAGVAFGYTMKPVLWTERRDDPRWPPIFDALYGAL